MHSINPGRHRKPKSAGKIAARTAISAGAAVAAVIVSAPAATADTTVNPFPCTGSPFDSVSKSVTGSHCGSFAVNGMPVG